ncbi:hypothetical protein A3197_03835 [Candidatus Thiodiazotropha endoloripes]|nr:hypothetical protein A3197_03835 [Candidatus Thiodiazotropha endoloripes]
MKLLLKSINLGRIFAHLTAAVKGRCSTPANFFAAKADFTGADGSSWYIITGSMHPALLIEETISSVSKWKFKRTRDGYV